MTGETLSYKCLSCGSPLNYSSDGKLKCSSCGNEYEQDVIKRFYDSENCDEKEFEWNKYKEDFENSKESLENIVVYICRSCGASIETTPTTAATHCPYCENEIIVSDRLKGGLKPNGIIPFKVDKKGLESKVEDFFKGKPLLPNNFKSSKKISKIQGVYVPFWLFDASLDGNVNMEAVKILHYSDSEYDITQEDYYFISMDGDMKFTKIPVDASIKMDNDLMDSLEPYDYKDLVDFDSSYLSGFLADRFDDSPDESLPRATERMKRSAEEIFINSIRSSFNNIWVKSNNMNLLDSKLKYVLLPVYLLNITYSGKNYRFAINGQTGKVVGELPISKVKQFLFSAGIFLGTFGVSTFILYIIKQFFN